MSLEAAEELKRDGLSVGVINMSTIKPLYTDAVLNAARNSGAIVTAEEHSIIGGLGGAVAEVISENEPVPLKRVGINDKFGMSGSTSDLLKHYGLTKETVKEAVHHVVKMKGIRVRD